MIVKYTRHHKVQPEEYESITFGATIEVDLSEDSVDEDYAGASVKVARDLLDEDMDLLLANAVERALDSDHLNTTHLYEYYEEK